MKKYLYLLSISLLALLSFQCKSTKESKNFSDQLNSGEFDVVKLNGNDVKDHKLTLIIDAEENRISGQSSCNNYGVSYEMKEDTLDLGFVIATKMYCEGEMEMEREFLKAVGNLNKFRYQDNNQKLSFFDEEGSKIIELTKQ